MRLAKAISLRLLFGLLSLVFVSFVTFVTGALAPIDPAALLAGEKASIADVERTRKQMGLDRPWPERYVKFVANAARGDLGNSYTGTKEPVREIIARTVPMTARLAILSIIVASLIGLILGSISGIWRTKAPDKLIVVLSTLGVTVPSFVLAPLFIYLFAEKYYRLPAIWQITRPEGDLPYLILPVAVLCARPTALITRLTRQSMIDTMQMEFIRMAVAKGVPKLRLYVVHALRNALMPVMTAIGTSFGFLLTGSFIVETIFTIPGIGQKTIESIKANDMPVIQGGVLVTGAMFIFINLLVDMLLPILDPRIRESQV